MGIAANIVLIALEVTALFRPPRRSLREAVIFYTRLSNFVTLISSVLFLFLGGRAASLRYLSTCMLTMTFAVTLFVLMPMGGDLKELMFSGSGLFHHTLCPIICFISYVLWERHSGAWLLPVIVTLIYGLIMIYLNAKKRVDGPYPFFRVHAQSRRATALWIAVLLLVISVISVGTMLIAR